MITLLNDEQRQLKDSAQEFLADKAPVAALRKLRDDNSADGFDRALWQEVVEMGWTTAIFPEEHGGLPDFGFKGLGAIFEQTGRNLSALPLLSSVVLGGSAILEAGSAEQQAAFLPAIIGGEVLFTLAVDENPRHHPLQLDTKAEKTADGYQLSGQKMLVQDGHVATHFIVAARSSGENSANPMKAMAGISLFIVDAQAAGVSVTRTKMLDSRNAAKVAFNNAPATLLGQLDAGFMALNTVLDKGRILIAAELLGICKEALDRTIAYMKERQQFGAIIGSFQALQHRVARLFVDLQLAEGSVAMALAALDEKDKQAPILASLAKQQTSDLAEKMLNEATQLHGGIGVTDELDIGLFLKRARVLSQLLGDGSFHRDRYAMMRGI